MRDAKAGFDPPQTLGEAFSRISALYFWGKLAYARHFGRGRPHLEAVQIITPSRGLMAANAPVTAQLLDEFADTAIGAAEARYRDALTESLVRLTEEAGEAAEFVFLGSLATPKYTSLLIEQLGAAVLTPASFVGMGNMRRGSVLLRSVDEELPLRLVSLREAVAPDE